MDEHPLISGAPLDYSQISVASYRLPLKSRRLSSTG